MDEDLLTFLSISGQSSREHAMYANKQQYHDFVSSSHFGAMSFQTFLKVTQERQPATRQLAARRLASRLANDRRRR
jgi:hypothetical protein